MFLDRENPGQVHIIEDKTQRRWCTKMTTVLIDEPANDESVKDSGDPLLQIAQNIHEEFAGSTNLIFANSRRTVETVAMHLKQLADHGNEYRLHHGSLSREVRTTTESALKSDEPVSAICTCTLELGIDIGAIEAVAQIDPPSTVSALVQRVGRSGRRAGDTARLQFFVRCGVPEHDAAITDLIFPDLLRAIALVRLAEQGWLEPQRPDRPHASTQAHQVLSLLKQYGGLIEDRLFFTLSQIGPFRWHSRADFKILLAGMMSHDVIQVDSEGYYVLSAEGERVTSRPDFYAAFAAPIELIVRHGPNEIGKLPTGTGLKAGDCLVLDARRWEVREVDWRKRTVWVDPARYAKPPVFLGGAGDVHARVHEEMMAVLRGADVPPWLDDQGVELLQSARASASHAGLIQSNTLVKDDGIHWFPWAGTAGLRTMALWAKLMKLECTFDCLSLRYSGVNLKKFQAHISAVRDADPVKIARLLPDRERQKFDRYVDSELLDRANAADRLNLPAALKAVQTALREINGNDSVDQNAPGVANQSFATSSPTMSASVAMMSSST